jgi:hypothetical protein
MSVVQPSCPYCNAPVAAVAPGSPRCARCGEPLPPGLAETAPSASLSEPAEQPALTPPGRGRTVAVVLTVMVAMAGIGLGYALWTTGFRRANDFRSKQGTPLVLQATAPAHVPALGLLPARSNVIAAINVAELLKQPASRPLLQEPRPALLAGLFAGLEKWTGLTPADIDHIALASEVRSDVPRLTLLLHTRQSYAPYKVAENLAPAQPTKHRNKLLVRFPLDPGEGLLWAHSERVLAVVLCIDAAKTDDLDAIPSQPRPGLEGFAEPLRDAIAQRLDKQSALWIAGDLGNSTVISDALSLTGVTTKGWAPLLAAKRFVAGVTPQEDLTLVAHLFTGEAKTAASLKEWLAKRRWPEATSHKVEAPPADALSSEQWVTLQVRGVVEIVRDLLSVSKRR